MLFHPLQREPWNKGYKFHVNTKRCVSWAGEPVE